MSTTPFTVNRVAQPEDEADFREALARHIPLADGPLLAMVICMYTCSPDSHFIIDRHTSHQQVVVLSPCSGHGFKFASAIGEVAADLATGRTPGFDLSLFSIERFASFPR